MGNRKPTEPLAGTEQAFKIEASVQSRYLNEHGHEIPNPTPLAPPIGYIKQPSIADQIRAQVRALSLEALQRGEESEEEANDFDVGEDYEPSSPWEHDFDVDPALEAMLALQSAHPEQPHLKPGAPVPAGPAAPAPSPDAPAAPANNGK